MNFAGSPGRDGATSERVKVHARLRQFNANDERRGDLKSSGIQAKNTIMFDHVIHVLMSVKIKPMMVPLYMMVFAFGLL